MLYQNILPRIYKKNSTFAENCTDTTFQLQMSLVWYVFGRIVIEDSNFFSESKHIIVDDF